MKMIKNLICVVVFTALALGAYAQSNSANSFVANLDRTVQLTDNQRTEITSLFNGLMADINGKTAAEIQAAKTTFNEDVRKALTPAQIARLDSPFKRIR